MMEGSRLSGTKQSSGASASATATVDSSMVVSKESARSFAIRALRAVSKSAVSALQLDEVPAELLYGQNLDLHRWTLVLNDKNLEVLSRQRNVDRDFCLHSSSDTVLGMFKGFYQPHTVTKGLITLDISNAKAVTDYGITLIARESPNLISLNISSCSKVTDIGLREIGMNCTKLQELNLSSCQELDGSGLSAIAECCRSLIKLNVSKCSALQNWSLKKVFYECTLLEEVNLSHLTKVSDEEVRVLAQNCPHIVSVEAIECPYISDSSIQTLAQHCTDLDLIDVSRTQMMYRITDVSLLALAQKSRSLRVLRLHGCDHITDVGLTWLAEGCHALEELDIGQCLKISDAGLRSIGSSCHSLTSVDLSQARTVTDVGISSLSVGCPKLRQLKLHGIFLLSDPRLSAPKKGAKLEAWQAVIGVAAMAENCPDLEALDLSGCFRLNIALHQYVSRFVHLKSLNLAGCNQSNTDALVAIAKGCNLIEELNLSDCGKVVNNKSMQAFAAHCPGIRVLTLCRCVNMSGGAVKAISTCEQLEKLDLTGCKNLTDSMLIHLSEVDKVPKLRTLSLVGIAPLTDSIIAWISIKAHNILLIALKGTSVSRKAVTSVRDRFPNSDLLMNDNFFGFWPKYRVDDRMLLNKYHQMIDGITRTQSRLRKHFAQLEVSGLSYKRRKYAAQCLLQRIARGFIGRSVVRRKRERIKLINAAAATITSVFRIAVAKKKFAKRIEYFHQLRLNALAARIQLCWRKHRDFKKLLRLRWEFEKLQERREFGALKMQSVAYIFFARDRVQQIKQLRRSKADVVNRKAVVIQRCYRGFVARKLARMYRTLIESLQRKRLAAAIRLQRKYRAYRTTLLITGAIALRKLCHYRATQIQSVMRGSLVRIHVAEKRIERVKKLRSKCAVKIQTRLRMLKAFIELTQLRAARERQQATFAFAAKIIVHAARKKIATLRANKLRMQKRKKMREQLQKEIAAVCKIQALHRGVLGRLRFDQVLREKKGKWKELFDEKKGKRFFYNKLSGEIRWRMPQDLLDLIPHPKCDDCTAVNATVECAVCNELFCSSCWHRVHAGGRRQAHDFRALYDYYGKRLDYGDGEFPCKWPTEVIQDEVQGWMLRVAPVRKPLRKYASGWEEYVEEVVGKKLSKASWKPATAPSEGRVFYFNRGSFETTYEQPEEVRREVEEEEAMRLQQEQLEQQQYQYEQYYDPSAQGSSGYYASDGSWVATDYYGNPLPLEQQQQQIVSYDENVSMEQYSHPPQPQSASSDYYQYSPQQVLPVSQHFDQRGVSAPNSFGDGINESQQQQQQELVPYNQEVSPVSYDYGYGYNGSNSDFDYQYANYNENNYYDYQQQEEDQYYQQQGQEQPYYQQQQIEYADQEYDGNGDQYGFNYAAYGEATAPAQEGQHPQALVAPEEQFSGDVEEGSTERLLIQNAPQTPARDSVVVPSSSDSLEASATTGSFDDNSSSEISNIGGDSVYNGAQNNSREVKKGQDMSLKSRLRSSLVTHDKRAGISKNSVKFK